MTSVNQLLGRMGRGQLRLGKHLRMIMCQSSFQFEIKPKIGRQISSSSKDFKFLSESSSIIQDGVNIEELPILIRRATRDTYPFTSHSYCGDNIRDESEFDITFKEMLEKCDTVGDVFNLLEVPSNKVQGHSAVYALQRLHVLMALNTDWQNIHSFIRKAVIGELYHIVERDVHLLSNFSLVTLVDCYFVFEGLTPKCSGAINEEISHRLVEGLFSIEELLSLVQSLRTGIYNSNNFTKGEIVPFSNNKKSLSKLESVLSENASTFLLIDKSSSTSAAIVDGHLRSQEILRNVWVHLASRYHDLDENTLPWTMELLSSSNKMFVPLLDKVMTHIWPYLSSDAAAMCLDNLVRLRVNNPSMMTKLGQWSFVNIHLVTPTVLLSFLNAYLHYSFMDKNLILVMEKCISKSGLNTSNDLLALCIQYLRSCKYVSPIILDVAAEHFSTHWESYSPLEIFAVLRSFGYLGYLPVKSQQFLFKAETCLDKRFDAMDEAQLLEVLASFTFVDVLPKNFFKRVSSEYFYKKVGALKNSSRTNALMWLKIMKHAIIIGSNHAITDKHLHWVMGRNKKWPIFLFRDKQKIAILHLKTALDQLFGPEYHHVIPFYSCCAMYLDANGIPLKISNAGSYRQRHVSPAKRLVILLRSANHFTSNTKQLIGSQRLRMTHLNKLGFTPIEIRIGEFYCQAGTSVLKTYLSHCVDFKNPDVTAMENKWMSELEKKYLKSWISDGGLEVEEEEGLSDGEAADLFNFLSSEKGNNGEAFSTNTSLDNDSTKD